MTKIPLVRHLICENVYFVIISTCARGTSDGRSRAGVYCAANACIEQVIQHGEVDVFQAVKTVRRHRPQLIESMVSYYYCIVAMRPKSLHENHSIKLKKHYTKHEHEKWMFMSAILTSILFPKCITIIVISCAYSIHRK